MAESMPPRVTSDRCGKPGEAGGAVGAVYGEKIAVLFERVAG